MNFTINELLAMDFKSFGKVIDAYIKGDASDTPLTTSQRDMLESREVLPRLYIHLKGIARSLEGQVHAATAAHLVKLADLNTNKEVAAEEKKFNQTLFIKRRFGLGLNDALTNVEWLFHRAFPELTALRIERDQLIIDMEKVKDALVNHRQQAFDDPEGWLDREEDLWSECSDLIGPSPVNE